MTDSLAPDPQADDTAAMDGAPVCVLAFNAADASGAGGVAGDVATIAAMGGHALPITCAVCVRDTAEVFDHEALDADLVDEQARTILEDTPVGGFKVGFLGDAENVTVVAELLSDYTDIPVVAYLGNLGWMEEDARQSYLDAWRELILPATAVLVGSHQTLTDFLLPEWDSERPASPRELAVAAAQAGTGFVLVTGVMLASRKAGVGAAAGSGQFIDNVLAGPQGAITGEKFEHVEATFVGAGDTLSAALATLLAVGSELQAAVGEALQFLDQSLEAGFAPGMGHVVPDRFFWAMGDELPEGDEGDLPTDGGPEFDPHQTPPGGSRSVH
ncbi:MAG: hydroxymethylpyrimidine/phosphomethylpyrimidine kinase [Proteobacteria bacterium]|nr:hydroxymethylpyrimidine/phosphomethylpyrimidine kinase [Pseudomonadota bacterium]